MLPNYMNGINLKVGKKNLKSSKNEKGKVPKDKEQEFMM